MKLKPMTVIGLNSGTSMDGVDAAAFRIVPDSNAVKSGAEPSLNFEMLASNLYEFKPALRKKMKALIASGSASLEDLARLDAALGEEFALAALSLIKEHKVEADLIGSHGQTIWHAPKEKAFCGIYCSNSLQIGQSAIIAERCGLPVISDFRVQDLSAGGQGAPLVCYADQVLFGKMKEGTGILNIGGIANITVLNENGKAIMAFDTGPGNMLADRTCERLFNREYDEGGRLAHPNLIDKEWLQQLLALPYFKKLPPKTTGRELFGASFADKLIEEGKKRKLSNEAILSTLTALTPASIAGQYEQFIQEKVKIESLVLGGGGTENQFMVEQLRAYWPHQLKTFRHEDFGISSKFKEALLFALLAYTTFFRIPNNVPACTGARHQVCLGKLTVPSR